MQILHFRAENAKKMQKYARKSKKHIIFDLELTGFVKKLGITDSKQELTKKPQMPGMVQHGVVKR